MLELSTDDILELPPEMVGGITFHLPMELAALRWAGADDDVIAARTADRLTTAFRVGMVDPPFYRWSIEQYVDVGESMVAGGEAAAMVGRIESLGAGLAGAAFHGLIRFGYGAMTGDPAEIARGLAYMRSRRQLMSPATVSGTPSAMPPAEELQGRTVFDILGIANTASCQDPGEQLDIPGLLDTAMALVRKAPQSFVAIHAVTSFHALTEIELLLDPDHDRTDRHAAPMPSWWTAYETGLAACVLAVASETGNEDLPGAGDLSGVADRAATLATAVAAGGTHEVKLAVSLCRLADLGLLDEAEAMDLSARNVNG